MEITSYLLGKKAGGGSTPTGTINITENGITNVSNYASADVNVQPNLETKSITITENTTTTLTPTSGKDGMSSVSITTDVSGGGGLDWSAIGYSGEPQAIIDGYDYAVEIMENWDATQSSLYGKFSQDKNLSIMPLVDTSQATRIDYMFYGCTYLLAIPLLNTSNVTNMRYTFVNCSSLKSVPLLNTSKVTSMRSMFSTCVYLKDIPLLNTTAINQSDGLQDFCIRCESLTNTSLDNILQMCINATSYEGTKTLVQLGFNSSYYSASRIQALPHYQDFIDAGWTIGY